MVSQEDYAKAIAHVRAQKQEQQRQESMVGDVLIENLKVEARKELSTSSLSEKPLVELTALEAYQVGTEDGQIAMARGILTGLGVSWWD